MCHEEENLENFRVFYQEAQQRRVHLSGIIVNLIGFTIAANALIWSILGQAYIESLDNNGQIKSWYLFIAALLSSIVIILWRWYTHYLDKQIIKDVYPSLAFYEAKLKIPDDLSSWAGVVNKAFKKEKNHTTYKQAILLSPDQRKNAVQYLIELKRYGCRGHNTINLIALIFIVIMWFISMIVGRSSSLIHWSMIGLIVSGGFFVLLVSCCFSQRNPSHNDIESAISEAKKEMKNSS